MSADPINKLVDLAEQQARTLNDPEALRSRLAELEGAEGSRARTELEQAIRDDPEAFNRALDSRDPTVVAAVSRALGGKG